MSFSACSMAASTRVGNALGAGSPERARLAALSSAVVAPALWVVVAFILTFPPTQNALLGLFTTGTDPLLLSRMRALLYLVVVLELFDGAQTILSGVLAGAGKQRLGAGVNAVAYWVVAVPAACLLGFGAKLGVQVGAGGGAVGWLGWAAGWCGWVAGARPRACGTNAQAHPPLLSRSPPVRACTWA